MGKTQSSAEEVLHVCFGLITTKANKMYGVENGVKVAGGPVHQQKQMINKKFIFN